MDLKAAADWADALSIALMQEPPCSSHEANGSTCISRARMRGGKIVSIESYDDKELCDACSAYWHATMLAARLQHLERNVR